MRLLVAQFPEGETSHELRFSYLDGSTEVVGSFDELTRQGDWLEVEFDVPRSGVVSVRVTTRSSPSWVAWGEVEILR